MRIVPFLAVNQFVFGISIKLVTHSLMAEDFLKIQIAFFGITIYWD